MEQAEALASDPKTIAKSQIMKDRAADVNVYDDYDFYQGLLKGYLEE